MPPPTLGATAIPAKRFPATTDGKVITVLVVSEMSDKLEVLLPDTKRVTINKSDIDERKLGDVSAMPPGVVKTVEELLDVIAYLMSNPTE